jgi:hypothetical protein
MGLSSFLKNLFGSAKTASSVTSGGNTFDKNKETAAYLEKQTFAEETFEKANDHHSTLKNRTFVEETFEKSKRNYY